MSLTQPPGRRGGRCRNGRCRFSLSRAAPASASRAIGPGSPSGGSRRRGTSGRTGRSCGTVWSAPCRSGVVGRGEPVLNAPCRPPCNANPAAVAATTAMPSRSAVRSSPAVSHVRQPVIKRCVRVPEVRAPSNPRSRARPPPARTCRRCTDTGAVVERARPLAAEPVQARPRRGAPGRPTRARTAPASKCPRRGQLSWMRSP